MSAVDVDDNKNVVAGGQTYDTTLFTQAVSSACFVLFIQDGGSYRWAKVAYYTTVAALSFGSDQNYVVVVFFSSAQTLVTLLQSSDGSVDTSYQGTNIAAYTSKFVSFDSSGRILIAHYGDTGKATFQCLDAYTGNQIAQWIKYTTNNADPMSVVQFTDSSGTDYLLSGILSVDSSSKYHANYVLIKVSDGTIKWSLGYNWGTYYYVPEYTTIYLNSTSSKTSALGVMNYFTTGSTYIFILQVQFSSTTIPTKEKAFYLWLPNHSLYARGVWSKSDYVHYLFIYDSTDYGIKLVKMTFDSGFTYASTTYTDLSPLQSSLNTIKGAVFANEYNVYYISDIKIINFVGQSYTYKVGSVMSAYNGQTCITANYTSYTSNYIYQWGNYITTSTEIVFSSGSRSWVANYDPFGDLIQGSLVDNSWCSKSMAYPEYPAYQYNTYYLFSGSKEFSIVEFKSIPYCSDMTFTYTPTLYLTIDSSSTIVYYVNTANDTIPSFMSYDSTNKKFTLDTSNINHQFTYYIMVTSHSTQNTAYTTSTTQYLFYVKNSCTTATISRSKSIDHVYIKISSGTYTYTFNMFSFSVSYCPVTYTLKNKDGTSYDTSVFSFTDSTDNTISSYLITDSSIPTVTKTYQLELMVVYTYGETNTASKTFDLDVETYFCNDLTIYKPTYSNFYYNISDSNETVTLSAWTYTTNYDCGTYAYSAFFVQSDGTLASLPTQFYFNDTTRKFSVFTDDVTLIGQYQIRIKGEITGSTKTDTSDFIITIRCLVRTIYPTSIKAQTYAVKSTAQYFNYTDFSQWPNCSYSFTYTSRDLDNNVLPSFITFYSSSKQFKVYTTTNSYGGSYYYNVTGTISNPPLPADYVYNSLTFQVIIVPTTFQITNLGPPVYASTLMDQNVELNKQSVYQLPSISDPDGDDYSVSVNLGTSSSFVQYSDGKFTISPIDGNNGTFQISITLTDDNDNPQSSSYTFYIVSGSNFNSSAELDKDKNNSSTDTNSFADKIIKTGYSITLNAIIKSISKNGLVKVKFSNEMYIPNNYNLFNSSYLRVRIIPSSDSYPAQLGFNWTITDFDSQIMQIQLNFENPTIVSKYDSDRLQIVFILNGYFIDKTNNKPIKNEYTCSRSIPKQSTLSLSQQQQMATASSGTSTVLKTIMIGNFAMNLLMSASLQYLWSAINVLQIMTHMPLLSIDFPYNAAFFYSVIISIANFNILPTQDIGTSVFEFNEDSDDSYNEEFNDLDIFSHQHIILSTLSQLNFTLLQFRCYIESWITILFPDWNWCICVCSNYTEILVQEIKELSWKNATKRFSSISAIALFILSITFPFFILLFAYYYLKKLKAYSQRFSPLIEQLKQDKKTSLIYNACFVGRRLLFAIACVSATNYAAIQIQILFFQTLFLIIYLLQVKPFETTLMNRVEYYNEITILVVSYHLIVFTDYVDNDDYKNQAGFSIIALTSLNMSVNMVVMVHQTVRRIRAKWPQYKAKIIFLLHWSRNKINDVRRKTKVKKFEFKEENKSVNVFDESFSKTNDNLQSTEKTFRTMNDSIVTEITNLKNQEDQLFGKLKDISKGNQQSTLNVIQNIASNNRFSFIEPNLDLIRTGNNKNDTTPNNESNNIDQTQKMDQIRIKTHIHQTPSQSQTPLQFQALKREKKQSQDKYINIENPKPFENNNINDIIASIQQKQLGQQKNDWETIGSQESNTNKEEQQKQNPQHSVTNEQQQQVFHSIHQKITSQTISPSSILSNSQKQSETEKGIQTQKIFSRNQEKQSNIFDLIKTHALEGKRTDQPKSNFFNQDMQFEDQIDNNQNNDDYFAKIQKMLQHKM